MCMIGKSSCVSFQCLCKFHESFLLSSNRSLRTDIAVASRAVQMAVRTTARTTGVVQEDGDSKR